jgi:hypothetical protein
MTEKKDPADESQNEKKTFDFTYVKEEALKLLKQGADYYIHHDTIHTGSEERYRGIRNKWFQDGILVGVYAGMFIFYPKYRLLTGSVSVALMLTRILSMANMNAVDDIRNEFLQTMLARGFGKGMPPSGAPPAPDKGNLN